MNILNFVQKKSLSLLACLMVSWMCTATINRVAAQSIAQRVQPSDSTRVKVMSYNIRYGTANDGANHWEHRREAVATLIRQFDPDLLGVQESLAFQTDFLCEQLPYLESIAVGRDDGKLKGEMTAIFFRRNRFQVVDSGHFWLSETPEIVASKSWDSSLTRMATWVRLKDLNDEKQREIFFLNTHFDHVGVTARRESAKLIRQNLQTLSKVWNIIITGDFNADEASQPYQALLDDSHSSQNLIDTYRKIYPNRKPDEGTFGNFKNNQIDGPRIDWIVVSSNWQVDSASIHRTEYLGRIPSDHFPVTAVLSWPK